jgi:hypothetical protein
MDGIRCLALFTTHPIQYQAPWFRARDESRTSRCSYGCLPDTHAEGEGSACRLPGT